ncbi:MAG: bifunctional UDP-N-acetylglucosamine diphosphorylase/glucosamine-1-phosphate N-acetyltransferase GlmU [Thermotogota bacterium]|nr:bifunctional UDP-N-acetylglucosamine diphosphorylase/glucosamine-1-phosphate N-acetyltransferase GlmU [Thermotogota bacterium]
MLFIVLAAGLGKRMKSNHPKVLHTLVGKPILGWVLSVCRSAFDPGQSNRIVVVVHPDMAEVVDYLEWWKEETGIKGVETVFQSERLGSGHAVIMAKETIDRCEKGERVVILSGDVPFVRPQTVQELVQCAKSCDGAVLTMDHPNPQGYGRVFRDPQGFVAHIVEDKDCTSDQRSNQEVNAGIYVFEAHALSWALGRLDNENTQREYYLPQTVEIIQKHQGRIAALKVDDAIEVSGVNDRLQLVALDRLMRLRINHYWLAEGVTIVDPENTTIEPEVRIGIDTIIQPYCFIKGKTGIGKDCVIGPFSQIADSWIDDGCVVDRSHLRGVRAAKEVHIGPFARLREGTELSESVRIGDFVELKKTVMGAGSKAQHLSYLGDATIGENVNIGAGTITCNYDGYHKYPTQIGKNAFIGSNTAIVAPVSIGEGAIVGAGSVIVENVEKDALALARGQQVQKPGRAAVIRERNKKQP